MQQALTAAALALKVFTLYFAVVFILGLRKRPSIPQHHPETRFAVVIAARNEGAVIGASVESLIHQDYPRELFDVFVVPNNCTDDTATRAAAAGARIFLPNGTVHCKGDALRQAFSGLMQEHYDAFVVFDADNRVDPMFLKRFNDAFCSGAQVVKGRHLARDPEKNWLAGCYDLYFRSFDFFFNRPRAALGLSCKLVGTGFGMRREVLLKQGGFLTETIAEDAEFASKCAAGGDRVVWVPEAVTYDEQPRTLKQSMVQRRRWCSGVMQVSALAVPMLAHGDRHSAPFRRDMSAFLLTPFTQAFSFIFGSAATICGLLSGTIPFWMLFVSAGVSYLSVAAAALLCGAMTHGLRRGMAKAVLMFPVFMMTWLPLQMLALVSKTTVWRPISHGVPARSALAAD